MLAFPLGPAVAHMVDTYWTIVKNKQDTAIKTWNGKHMAVTAPQQILNPNPSGQRSKSSLLLAEQ